MKYFDENNGQNRQKKAGCALPTNYMLIAQARKQTITWERPHFVH